MTDFQVESSALLTIFVIVVVYKYPQNLFPDRLRPNVSLYTLYLSSFTDKIVAGARLENHNVLSSHRILFAHLLHERLCLQILEAKPIGFNSTCR